MELPDAPRHCVSEYHKPEPSEPEALPIEPETRRSFHRWARCFCVYVFDVEQGQRLEMELPPGSLSEADRRLLGYLAFPDSGPSRSHSAAVAGREAETATFGFRFRQGSGAARGSQRSNSICRSRSYHSGSLSPSPRGPATANAAIPQRGDFLYGVACFRQQPDASRPRHCVQRSLVIVSQHSLIGFFTRVMSYTGGLFYQFGPPILESVLHSIAGWPDPEAGSASPLELPVAGEVFSLSLPHAAYGGISGVAIRGGPAARLDVPGAFQGGGGGSALLSPLACVGGGLWLLRALQPGGAETSAEEAGELAWERMIEEELLRVAATLGIARCRPTDVPQGPSEPQKPFSSFSPLMECLWILWEIVLCGEPLLIFSPDYPTRVACAVLAATTLIAPIEYAGDFRPYFTIYDGDFESYKQQAQGHTMARTAVIIGATNPVVLRLLSDMPSCVVLSPRGAGEGGVAGVQPPQGTHDVLFQSGSGDWMQRARLAGQGAGGARAFNNGTAPRRFADYGFAMEPDLEVVRCLEAVPGQPLNSEQEEVRNNLLRRHFYDLTLTFLRPFVPHLGKAAVESGVVEVGDEDPGVTASSDSAAETPPPAFDEMAFLESLQPVGVFATMPQRVCQDLYARFMRGANFRPWLEKQHARSQRWRDEAESGQLADPSHDSVPAAGLSCQDAAPPEGLASGVQLAEARMGDAANSDKDVTAVASSSRAPPTVVIMRAPHERREEEAATAAPAK